MIVEQIMNTELHKLLPENTVRDAVHLMRDKKIRHVPIVNKDNVIVGIVTEHDIKNALPSSLRDEPNSTVYDASIESIMTKNPIVGHPLDFVEEIALTVYESKISCIPIVSVGELVGIVTTSDLLYTYIELTGTHQPSSKVDIRVADRPGMLYEITKIFYDNHANILNILIYPDGENEKSRILSVRLQVINPLSIIEDLRQQGYDVLWPNLPGVIL
ncbi:acetoin utilization protein AcuB [Lysinibacillus sp. 2017]|uniref:acetoin utilization AcuB family protein n=1 Tax=unclassified Lysinibacillus TaxID=2636778 RepID=UPI000D528D8E|nr:MULTISPECIES: acetoin utilization AcuB family protein [unclassified Lysinibacillus]AWE08356.1 acetoin utilization protein AcuB [Lysinibacillus sp. 2017]TGN35795.1 CBS domain-containing protein [Lysinibacillus sp. S2017]